MNNDLDDKLSEFADMLLARAEVYRSNGKSEIAHEVMWILDEILMIQGVI
jgi:hypothetical protein